MENTKIQVKNLGADLVTDEIFHISWNQDFTLEGREGSYRAKAVLLATGTSRKKADIEGLSRLEGHGVSYCAICDAFFYRGRKVAVLGNEEYAVHELAQLLPVACSAALLTDGKELKAEVPEGVQVITKKIRSVDGEEAVTGVTFTDGERLPADGLFVALGSAGAVDLARKVGALTDGRSIQVDETMATNVPGLFAAGDCTGGLLQISTAVGEGVAIPHAKTDAVREPGLVAITVPGGVDWKAPDGKPSDLIFLIAAPETEANVHLEVLGALHVFAEVSYTFSNMTSYGNFFDWDLGCYVSF